MSQSKAPRVWSDLEHLELGSTSAIRLVVVNWTKTETSVKNQWQYASCSILSTQVPLTVLRLSPLATCRL